MTNIQPTRASVPPPRKNGGEAEPTPDELAVAAAITHHVQSYKQVCSERDELQKKVDRQEQMLTVAKIEIEGLRADAAATVSRMEGYQIERDEAVADLVVYQTLFITVQGILRTFGIEHTPLIKKLPHDPSA